MASNNPRLGSAPGVTVTEIQAFGTEVVGVATAIPIFIGYTQFAGDPLRGTPLTHVPVAIASMADYVGYFGGPAFQPFSATETGDVAPTGGGGPDRFQLYWQMRLFFANGGGDCHVVSVGSYWVGQHPVAAPTAGETADWARGTITADELIGGIDAAGDMVGPTMLVIPEACQLDAADYGRVTAHMVEQAGNLQDRMAILDLPGALEADTVALLTAAQATLWTALAGQEDNLPYSAAYAPALRSTVVTTGDVGSANLVTGDNRVVNALLTAEACGYYRDAQQAAAQAAIAAAFPLPGMTGNNAEYSADAAAYPAQKPGEPEASWRADLDAALASALPAFQALLDGMAEALNLQPPSGAIAGIWAQNDAQKGVWNAPANVAPVAVTAPLCQVDDDQQAVFNVPVNGMAINIIRSFAGQGTLVWGARTLDGNSMDYRFIPVRRTLIYIGQSIKNALQSYAFAANDATTWVAVTASISAFLTGLWQQGGLIGDKPGEAFQVQCGLGSSMKGQDVLDGDMIVSVTLAITHPAEFIVLSFKQAMQG